MIAIDRLIAAALGELSGDAEVEVEEHVLSCSECAARYATLLELQPAIAERVRDGAVDLPISEPLMRQLDATGLITRRYSLVPGQPVPCTVGPGDIYSLTTYSVDLAGVTRLDLMHGTQRIPDIPFDAERGRVYMLTPATFLRPLPSMRIYLRLLAVDGAEERELATYILDHTVATS